MKTPELVLFPAHSSASSGQFVLPDEAMQRDSVIGSKLLVPIIVVLTFVGLVNSLQTFYIFFGGAHTFVNFVRFLISDMFYCWYFILPALTVRWLSGRVHLQKGSVVSWVSTHLGTLMLLTVVHQTASLVLDRLVLGSRQADTVSSVLFKNPGVWGDFVVYVLFLMGFYMVQYRKQVQDNEMRCSLLEMELVNARLRELRRRIHPQFLFNTLNEARDLVRRGRGREANRALSLLSDFLRITVYGGEEEETALEDELSFVHSYLAIEKMRFGRRLVISERIDSGVRLAVVPNLILQPLVEAILVKKLEGSGTGCYLDVAAQYVDDRLEMVITWRGSNIINTPGAKDPWESVIEIARERLTQLYHDEFEFNIDDSHHGSEVVIIRIPFRSRAGVLAAQQERVS